MQTLNTQFSLRKVRRNYVSEGCIGLSSDIAQEGTRQIVKISHNSYSIHSEVLVFDKDFTDDYNKMFPKLAFEPCDHVIMLNRWYRERLGIKEWQHGETPQVTLKISLCNTFHAKILACLDHPQTSVRVSTWLGIISVTLGLFSIIQSSIGMIPFGR